MGLSKAAGYDNSSSLSTAPIVTRDVHEIAIAGSWPSPAAPARDALKRVLTDIPDKSDVLLDGLVACGVPELLEPHARRLRLIVLVHLPLSDETGLPAAEATRLRILERHCLHAGPHRDRHLRAGRLAHIRNARFVDRSRRWLPASIPAPAATPDRPATDCSASPR